MPYFSNVKHNSAVLNAFAEVMRVMNHIGQRNAELAWYYPSIARRVYFYDLKHSLRIHSFTLPNPIVKPLATQTKFYQLSGNYTLIDCAFTF